MVITIAPKSVFPRVEMMPKKSFFLDFDFTKNDVRLRSCRFTDALLHRVVSATVICGHRDPAAPDRFDLYCEELFAAIGDEPFIFLPELGFAPVIVATLDGRWIRDLQGIVRRPARVHGMEAWHDVAYGAPSPTRA